MSLDKNLRWTLLYHSHMRMRHSKKGNEKTSSCRVKHATFNLHFKGLHTNLKALCIVFLGQCSQFTLCGDGGGVGGGGGCRSSDLKWTSFHKSSYTQNCQRSVLIKNPKPVIIGCSGCFVSTSHKHHVCPSP